VGTAGNTEYQAVQEAVKYIDLTAGKPFLDYSGGIDMIWLPFLDFVRFGYRFYQPL
jgi:hypothetical protein